MPINRLLSGHNFTPESIAVIWQAYHAAIIELRISPSDEATKERLAKLVIDTAAPKQELSVDKLLELVMSGWNAARKAMQNR